MEFCISYGEFSVSLREAAKKKPLRKNFFLRLPLTLYIFKKFIKGMLVVSFNFLKKKRFYKLIKSFIIKIYKKIWEKIIVYWRV